jgi:hypothetical protein
MTKKKTLFHYYAFIYEFKNMYILLCFQSMELKYNAPCIILHIYFAYFDGLVLGFLGFSYNLILIF